MPYKYIKYQKIKKVAVISIKSYNSGVKLVELSAELDDLCDKVVEEEEIRVVILTGFGGKPLLLDTELPGNILGTGNDVYKKLPSLAKSMAKLAYPLIAAIDGDAIGLSLELALACDIRVATETAHFGLPHIHAGLIPWDGGTQRLSRIVGKGKALEMILTGEIIEGHEAYRIGLLNRIVSSGEVMKWVMDLAQQMASKAPIPLRYAKEAINKGMDLTLEQGLRLEADLYFLLHTTHDRMEGIKAFREKRNPNFEGK